MILYHIKCFMEDKDILEEQLLVIKGVCDLYLHGTLEATTKEVHDTFKCALNENLDIQNKIYNLMKDKGWYQTDTAEQTKIESTKQKFLKNC